VEPVPAGDGQPRLVVDGEDRTPSFEPLPELTVDRLVRVRLTPGVPTTARVLMHGACVGRMSNLADGTSCVDAARLLDAATAGDGPEDGSPSAAGSILRRQRLDPPELPVGIPVRGGAFVLGGDDLDVGAAQVTLAPKFPPRAAIVSGFVIDREEVSVARMRTALAAGLRNVDKPRANPGPLATSSADATAACTYRDAPDPADPERELLPVTCVTFDTARAFCQHEGGDLPTEAQWEYAAAAAGRPRKTRYPWGNEAPSCAGVVFARFDQSAVGDSSCHDLGFPFGLRGASTVTLDVTGDGVRGLAGGASEWVRGAALPYDSACYQRAGLVDPVCESEKGARVVRGGSFVDPASALSATLRTRIPSGQAPAIGFRCVHGP
jgi:formylglycine-generating enzyme required for sulfatase activity